MVTLRWRRDLGHPVRDATVEGARLAQEQLDLSRRFVAGELSVPAFVEPFLRARNAEVDAGSCHKIPFLDLLNDIWFAIDMHNEYDEPREPDEFDAQLLDVVTPPCRLGRGDL